MSWKKYFTPVNTDNQSGSFSPISGGGRPGPAKTNYSSYLPDVYAGSPNRIEKYMQYDTMDMDSEVNAALVLVHCHAGLVKDVLGALAVDGCIAKVRH